MGGDLVEAATGWAPPPNANADWKGGGPPVRLLEEGELIAGTYVVRHMLGRGGMGQVFAADDVTLQRSVAVKTMAADGDDDVGALLRREAQALAQVRHPSVVTVHAMGVHRGLPYLVMERLYGSTMAEQIAARRARGTSCAIGDALEVLIAVAEGLAAVHDAGVAHRDLKPGNVFVCANQRAVLLDLGIMVPEVDAPTAKLCGTPHYMAPELIDGSMGAGRARLVDVYAFGAVAYEVLTGRPPFDHADLMTLLEQQMFTPAPDLRAARNDVPPELAGLVAECLAKEPTERPSRMDMIGWELRGIRSRRPASPAGAQRVLIVDDDRDAIELMRASVQSVSASTEINAVHTCEAGLHALRHTRASLVLLDLSLPGMSGIDFCARARGLHLLDGVTVVVVTADDDERARIELERLGVTRVVRKGKGLTRRLAEVVAPLCTARRAVPSK